MFSLCFAQVFVLTFILEAILISSCKKKTNTTLELGLCKRTDVPQLPRYFGNIKSARFIALKNLSLQEKKIEKEDEKIEDLH